MGRLAWLLAGTLIAAPSSARADPPPEPRPAEDEERAEEPAPSEAEEREILDFVRGHDEEMAERISRLRRERPEMFRRRLREVSHMYRDPEIRERFVRQHKARREIHRLVQDYRKAQGKDKDAVKAKLHKALSELFDLDAGNKELQIKKMQEQIGKLREKIAQRRAKKDALVRKRLERLTGEEEDSDW